MMTAKARPFRRIMVFLFGGVLIVAVSASRLLALPEFLDDFHARYPDRVGSKLDDCALCHTVVPDLNPFGLAYSAGGGGVSALANIESQDSDGDGATNLAEIFFGTFPGDATDVPPTLPIRTPTPTPTSIGTPTVTPTVTETLPPAPTPTTVGNGSCAIGTSGPIGATWAGAVWVLPAMWLVRRRRQAGGPRRRLNATSK